MAADPVAPAPSSAPGPSLEAISTLAYRKYLARGAVPGAEQEDWFEAERELLANGHRS